MSGKVFGVVAPHPPIFMRAVGGDEAHVAAASLNALGAAGAALADFAPETIVLMSPHAPSAYDTFLVERSPVVSGDLLQFGDPSVYEWPGDQQLAEALVRAIGASGIPAAPRDADSRLRAGWLDHASIVPLSFLAPSDSTRLVVVSLSSRSYADHRRVGAIVSETADTLGRKVAFVASGDMSHRLSPDSAAGYSPLGATLDAAIVDCVREGTLAGLMEIDPAVVEAGGECGLRSLIALGGFAGDDPVPTRVLAYEGPWGVGYLTALVGEAAVAGHERTSTTQSGRKGGAAGHDESAIVRLARATIESYVLTGAAAVPEPLSDSEYPARAGAFVSLHRGGELRGCIGTISATRDSLAEEVAANAVQAAAADPRFEPLVAEELRDLDVKVDVLQPPETCTYEDLDPARYGVIVTSGYRRGLLLPDLEGVDDVPTQISIAMRKAGIAPDSRCELQRFRVDRYT